MRNLWKWLLVLAILAASLVASAVMLQAMGVIDLGPMALKQAEKIPSLRRHVAIYRLGLEAERASEREGRDTVLLRSELAKTRALLEEERASLESEWAELEKARALLDQRERQLDAREETLRQQAANVADFERLRALFEDMRPRDVVPILDELDDDLVARLLRQMDDDQASDILTQLDPARAAALSRMIGGVSSKE